MSLLSFLRRAAAEGVAVGSAVLTGREVAPKPSAKPFAKPFAVGPGAAAAKLRLAGEALAEQLPALLVAAERVAATVAQGVHGRRRTGAGHSFWQFRPYLPGDPVARIDWRETGKSDRAFIREQEWDAAQSVWIGVDRSASMAWRSQNRLPEKIERAQLLGLALAALLLQSGERVALLGSRTSPAVGRAVLHRIAGALLSEVPLADNQPLDPLPLDALPRHATLVVFSDFLNPIAETRAWIGHFRQRGVRGHLVQILDPAEEELPYQGRVRFTGLEQDGALLVSRVESLRAAYRQRLAAHREELATLARLGGWSFSTHRTDRSPESALLAIWASLSVDAKRGAQRLG